MSRAALVAAGTALACIAALWLACWLAGGMSAGTHSTAGGYRDACGSLPGILGDDC